MKVENMRMISMSNNLLISEQEYPIFDVIELMFLNRIT